MTDSRVNAIAKLVSAARAIVTYQVGLPHGVTRLHKLLAELAWTQNSEYVAVREYLDETRDLPVGTERLRCDREALKRWDVRLEAVNTAYRDRIFDMSFRILDKHRERTNDGEAEREQ